jgi:glucosamine-phosphate N-acetyltransferase
MAAQGIFSEDLLSPEVAAALPEGYKLRPLNQSDYSSGFLDCLRVLTTVGEFTEEQFQKQYETMSTQGGYYIVVIEDTSRTENKVVGTGALIVERKL